MGRTSPAATATLLCLLLCTEAAQAAVITINPRPNPPTGFFAIPERNIHDVLSNPDGIRQKLLGNPRRPWGRPHGITAHPDLSPGQWYLFPVCHGELDPRAGKSVEETDTNPNLTCQ